MLYPAPEGAAKEKGKAEQHTAAEPGKDPAYAEIVPNSPEMGNAVCRIGDAYRVKYQGNPVPVKANQNLDVKTHSGIDAVFPAQAEGFSHGVYAEAEHGFGYLRGKGNYLCPGVGYLPSVPAA
jgi:hypothetical protein